MRVTINYETNADAEYVCCARTEIQGRGYFGIGRTWEDAKANLLKKVEAVVSQSAPAPETVEVKVAGEEMDTEFQWEKQAEQMGNAMNIMLEKISGVKE